MISPQFKTLFHLSNHEIDIVEIKHLGLPGDSDKSLIFYWFMISKGNAPIRLTFASMTEEGENQIRDFKEGELSFNGNVGFYTSNSGDESNKLTVVNPPALSTRLIQSIKNFLP
ncbi:MAG: hypothetical protein V7776_03120 [Halopseudomonas aestusnigri]